MPTDKTPIYPYLLTSDAFDRLRDSLSESLLPLARMHILEGNGFAALNATIDALKSQLPNMVITSYASENFVNAMKLFSEQTASMMANSFKQSLHTDFSNIFKDISLQNGYVELTEECLSSVNTLLDASASDESNFSTEKVNTSKKIPIQEFIFSILLPILSLILPMLQNSYYHKIDELEAQKQHLESNVYQEQILELTTEYNENMEQLNTSISELLEYLESGREPLSENQVQKDSHSSDEITGSAQVVNTQSDFSSDGEFDNNDIQSSSE